MKRKRKGKERKGKEKKGKKRNCKRMTLKKILLGIDLQVTPTPSKYCDQRVTTWQTDANNITANQLQGFEPR
eukprot:scaffold69036_cov28-Prasinocladus_malaysianus.AAC.1